jgi:cobalt-zinc-cadmium efflux system outer membrane protein
MMQGNGGGRIRESVDRGIDRFRLFDVLFLSLFAAFFLLVPFATNAGAASGEVRLQDLIDEALKNSPVLQASESRVAASTYRIPQVTSLPDPELRIGYQNDGFDSYSLGDSPMSQWMFSASQMFPFPGKLPLKGEIARRDSEGFTASYDALRLKTVRKVKELYYDLFLAYKDIDLIRDKITLFSRIEDAALARYSTGMAQQQEVLMAQTEKYRLLEKEEMVSQKRESVEAMLNATIGRDVNAPLGRPAGLHYEPFDRSLKDLVDVAWANSPEIREKEKMVSAAEIAVRLAERQYYPDITVSANYSKRAGAFADMWALSTAVNIPLFYRTKQRQGVLEARARYAEAKEDLESTKLAIAAEIRDNYSREAASGRLMSLYREGLIPKATQDFEAAIAGYATGKADVVTAITALKSLVDADLLYWDQLVEGEKAVARIEAITGGLGPAAQGDK